MKLVESRSFSTKEHFNFSRSVIDVVHLNTASNAPVENEVFFKT